MKKVAITLILVFTLCMLFSSCYTSRHPRCSQPYSKTIDTQVEKAV